MNISLTKSTCKEVPSVDETHDHDIGDFDQERLNANTNANANPREQSTIDLDSSCKNDVLSNARTYQNDDAWQNEKNINSTRMLGSRLRPRPPFLVNCIISGLAGMNASALTQPIDILKVRMQLSGEMASNISHKPRISSTLINILKNDGLSGLYKGLSASLLRQAIYTTARLGTYEPFKRIVAGDKKDISLYQKLLVGMTSGALGSALGSPCDIVLIRMQADGRLPLEQRRNYKNVFEGIKRIASEEKIINLWKGCLPNVQRAMLLNAVQLGTYDETKKRIADLGLFKENSYGMHFCASMISGLLATIVTAPFDVAKTRLMSQKTTMYKGTFDCLVKTFRYEGMRGLYKGFLPNYLRLAPHTVILLMTYEQLKNRLGY